jgi:hypothetical protein
MGTMTPKSIVDAKGDIIAASANDTPARLAVGANGTALVADSTQSTGLAWVATPAASNPVLNSAFNTWQRSTTFAITTPVYTADRWMAGRSANTAGSTVTRQVTGDTTNLPNIQYCLRFARDSGSTSLGTFFLNQSIESTNSIPFAGKTVRLSFYARAGANYSAAGSLLTAKLVSGTGTDQNLLTAGYTGSANVISDTATLTTTWQRFTYTGAVGATATELGIMFESGQSGTAGAADYFEVTGVQIDIGSVALPFRTAGVSYQQELALCQRYFAKSYSQGTAPATNSSANGLVFAQSAAIAASSAYIHTVNYPVVMRQNPTVTIYSFTSSQTARISDGAGTDLAAASGAVNLNNEARFTVQNNSGGALTAAQGGFVFHYTASAEL